MPTVEVERSDSTLIVTLNRPDRLNAINPEMQGALTDAWQLASDPAVGAVVVTGAGRAFCAGADLRRARGSDPPPGLRYSYNPNVLAMAALDKPVIAAVNGTAAGAGLGLVLGSDIRIASSVARLVPAFVAAGTVPDAGTSFFAVRSLGYHDAFGWLTSGRPMSAEEALVCRAVEQVVDPERLLATALERAKELVLMPGAAVGLTKRLLRAACRATLAEQLEAENDLQRRAREDPGGAAAWQAAGDRLKISGNDDAGDGD